MVHHYLTLAGDVVLGAVMFAAGLFGWLDGVLPHFVTWGGALLVAYRLWATWREWKSRQ